MKYTKFKTSLCDIILVGDDDGLRFLHLDTHQGKRGYFEISQEWNEDASFFKKEQKQIEEYFAGERTIFDIKLNIQGTDFQKKVWNALRDVKYGETASYKDIARAIGNEKASRAVGTANGRNPIPLIIPCHRIIGENGNLAGFAHGIDFKQKLIDIEKA